MNYLDKFPDAEALIAGFPNLEIGNVNSHVHTPYSFSAFTDVDQLFEMAEKENIAALGINDFFVTDGYEEFYHEAINKGIFPLFNIEFIALLKKEQQEGIRINDPSNPGRCYFCGKGLNYPFEISPSLRNKLSRVIGESQDQVKAMIAKANSWMASRQVDIFLTYDNIRKLYAKELVRERHIAKAIRIAIFDKYHTESDRQACFTNLFSGKIPGSSLSDIAGLENEIRGKLLKAGGPAFVEENEAAFLSLDEIIEIIVQAGGIPCYPVLLDDKNGQYTEFEKDPEKLFHELNARNIRCLELIPGRNDAMHLQRFVQYFYEKDFIILLGSEHNTPEMMPITCDTRDKAPLSDGLKRISYEGACVIAAHQYLKGRGLTGFMNQQGVPGAYDKKNLVKLGNAVIHQFHKQFKKS